MSAPKNASGAVKRKKKPRGVCADAGCHESRLDQPVLGVKHHVFPVAEETRKKWIAFVQERRPGWTWTSRKKNVLCNEHFADDAYANRMSFKLGFAKRLFLRKDAFPTIHYEPPAQLDGNPKPCPPEKKSVKKTSVPKKGKSQDSVSKKGKSQASVSKKGKSRSKKSQPCVEIETASSEFEDGFPKVTPPEVKRQALNTHEERQVLDTNVERQVLDTDMKMHDLDTDVKPHDLDTDVKTHNLDTDVKTHDLDTHMEKEDLGTSARRQDLDIHVKKEIKEEPDLDMWREEQWNLPGPAKYSSVNKALDATPFAPNENAIVFGGSRSDEDPGFPSGLNIKTESCITVPVCGSKPGFAVLTVHNSANSGKTVKSFSKEHPPETPVSLGRKQCLMSPVITSPGTSRQNATTTVAFTFPTSSAKPSTVILKRVDPTFLANKAFVLKKFNPVFVTKNPNSFIQAPTSCLFVKNTATVKSVPKTASTAGLFESALTTSDQVGSSVPVVANPTPSTPVNSHTNREQSVAIKDVILQSSDTNLGHSSSSGLYQLPVSSTNMRHFTTAGHITMSTSSATVSQLTTSGPHSVGTANAIVGHSPTALPVLLLGSKVNLGKPLVAVSNPAVEHFTASAPITNNKPKHCHGDSAKYSTKLGRVRYCTSNPEVWEPVVKMRKLGAPIMEHLCRHASISLAQFSAHSRNSAVAASSEGATTISSVSPHVSWPGPLQPVHSFPIPARNPLKTSVSPVTPILSPAVKTVTVTQILTHGATPALGVRVSNQTSPKAWPDDSHKDAFASNQSDPTQASEKEQSFSVEEPCLHADKEDTLADSVMDVEGVNLEANMASMLQGSMKNDANINRNNLDGKELRQNDKDNNADGESTLSENVEENEVGGGKNQTDPDDYNQNQGTIFLNEHTKDTMSQSITRSKCSASGDKAVNHLEDITKCQDINNDNEFASSGQRCEKYMAMEGKKVDNLNMRSENTAQDRTASSIKEAIQVNESEDQNVENQIMQEEGSKNRTLRVKYGEGENDCDMDMTVDEVVNDESMVPRKLSLVLETPEMCSTKLDTLSLFRPQLDAPKRYQPKLDAPEMSNSVILALLRGRRKSKGIVALPTDIVENKVVFRTVVKQLLKQLSADNRYLVLQVDFADAPPGRRNFDFEITGHLLGNAKALNRELEKVRMFLVLRRKNTLISFL